MEEKQKRESGGTISTGFSPRTPLQGTHRDPWIIYRIKRRFWRWPDEDNILTQYESGGGL